MIVELLKSDRMLGVSKGQRFIAQTYPTDPSKITLVWRVSKTGRIFKKNVMCNQYRTDVKIIT